MTVNRMLLIAATICFAVLFVLSLQNGWDTKDLGWLGFTLFAGGHAV